MNPQELAAWYRGVTSALRRAPNDRGWAFMILGKRGVSARPFWRGVVRGVEVSF